MLDGSREMRSIFVDKTRRENWTMMTKCLEKRNALVAAAVGWKSDRKTRKSAAAVAVELWMEGRKR